MKRSTSTTTIAAAIRMRVSSLRQVAILGLLSTLMVTAAKGGTISDSFDTPHDYSSGDVSGTIWSGVHNLTYLNQGNASTTTPGALFWASKANAGWDANVATAPVLYRTVAGDFDVSVHVLGMTNNTWSDGGLTIRTPAGNNGGTAPGEDYVALRYFATLGFNSARSTDGITTNNYDFPAFDSYLRIEKTGATFQFYTKATPADIWHPRFSLNRPDMASVGPLQVGLWFGTNTPSPNGNATFDDFVLSGVNVPEPSTSLLAALGAGVIVMFRKRLFNDSSGLRVTN